MSDPTLDVYGSLERLAIRLEEGQRRIFRDKGITAALSRNGSAHCIYFMEHVPESWWELASNHDFDFDIRYRQLLIERGIYQFPVPTKQGSISFAHSEEDIEITLEATRDGLR